MPYKYIGRKTDFSGKPLWEIIGNLKDFGVGRFVYRNMNQRYPEPSYMKILEVQPCNPDFEYHRSICKGTEQRKVIVWVEKVFRGKRYPEPIKIFGSTYKADFRLVPKDQEKEFCKPAQEVTNDCKVFEPYIKIPSLLRKTIENDFKNRGEKINPDFKVPLVLVKGLENRYRLAKDGESFNTKVSYEIKPELAPNIYKNI